MIKKMMQHISRVTETIGDIPPPYLCRNNQTQAISSFTVHFVFIGDNTEPYLSATQKHFRRNKT
jgi:hypothetical protein